MGFLAQVTFYCVLKGNAMTDLRSWLISRKPAKLALAAAALLAWSCLSVSQSTQAEPAEAVCEDPTPAAIQVTVENVRSSKGLITAVLYDDNPDTFLKKGARLDRIRVEAREGETLLCLNAPSAGRYTVALYHDENGNKEFDRNFLGIPSEGYGFSNNPGFRFGKPKQKETLFSIENSLTSLRVSVLYL